MHKKWRRHYRCISSIYTTILKSCRDQSKCCKTLHKKWSFPLRFSSVNVTKFAGNYGFGHIYWRNPYWKTSFFVQWKTISQESISQSSKHNSIHIQLLCDFPTTPQRESHRLQMLTKIGEDVIAHSINYPYFAYFSEFLLYNSDYWWNQPTLCGSNSTALRIEKSKKFYCAQAAKTMQSVNVVEESNFTMETHFRSYSKLWFSNEISS